MENRSHDSSPRASFVSTGRDPFPCESTGGLLFRGRRVWGPHQCLQGFPQLPCSAAHDAPRPRLAAARRFSNGPIHNRKDLCARFFVICGAWLCVEPLLLGDAQSAMTHVSLRRLAQSLSGPLWRSTIMLTWVRSGCSRASRGRCFARGRALECCPTLCSPDHAFLVLLAVTDGPEPLSLYVGARRVLVPYRAC